MSLMKTGLVRKTSLLGSPFSRAFPGPTSIFPVYLGSLTAIGGVHNSAAVGINHDVAAGLEMLVQHVHALLRYVGAQIGPITQVPRAHELPRVFVARFLDSLAYIPSSLVKVVPWNSISFIVLSIAR
jgi:hypothetical protein